MDAQPTGRGRRRELEALVRRQHGVVTRAQLREAGVGRGAIEGRRKSGRLVTIHRGVFRVGPAELPLARQMAAVLACGNGAAVSHDHAGALHGLLPHPPRSAPVHVSVPSAHPRRRGINVHGVLLRPDERTTVNAVPVTTVPRTVLDLATTRPPDAVEQLIAEAFARNLTTADELRTLVDRYPRRHGTRALRSILADGPPARIRSEAERRFLALIRAAGLPQPRVNERVLGYEVDFLWPEERLIVEVDGHAFHASRPKRERDARRDQELALHGHLVMRTTWRQITREPAALVARIGVLLERLRAERRAA